MKKAQSFQFLIRLAYLLVTVCLSACATTYSPTTSNPAKIRDGRLIRSWLDWDSFLITQIDGKPVGDPMLLQSSGKVDAGRHELLIFHKGNRPSAGFVSAGYLPLVANFEPSKKYDVAASEASGVVRVWMRDVQTGKAVSEPNECRVMPIQGQGDRIYIPIVVPSR